jgi:murein L,D-transpeptidase YcbB/YkuD
VIRIHRWQKNALFGLLGLLVLESPGLLIATSKKITAYSTSKFSSIPTRVSIDGEVSLRQFIEAAELPDLHWPNFASYQTEVREFYDESNGTLPWIDASAPSRQARVIIRALKNAADKGLEPRDYDGFEWNERADKIESSTTVPELDLVKFDLALTVSAMRYISDLHMGRVNPRLFHFGLDIGHRQIDLSEFLRKKLVSATDTDVILRTVEPPFPIYARTEKALKQYMEFARMDDGALLPVHPRPITPGESYSGLPRLTRLLALLGDLPTDYRSTPDHDIYQGTLVDAVRHFQRRHGLEPNGLLNARTITKLNSPLSRRVTQLELAMERMRWLPHQFERPPIVVNIPEFRLYVLNDSYRTASTMNVVVGKSYGHQTPVFANEIKSVIFRPYWNVPESILKTELLPLLEKNPAYFSNNSYEILDKNEQVVSEGMVSGEIKAQLRAGKLRVRQTPGLQNALGLVKFEFPNEYDVYMHDTPAQHLFSRPRRDFSHGCIRVEDPMALAKWVLHGMPEWTDETIGTAMNGNATQEVKLKEPVPVLILYSTAVVLEGQAPHFLDDIYGLDADLERALTRHIP